MRVAVATVAVALAVLLVAGVFRGRTSPPSGTPAARATVPRVEGEQRVPIEGDYLVSAGSRPSYASNPPASGAQLVDWAGWGVHAREVPRAVWVHNLAHGGVVLAYRPDAPPGVVAALLEAYREMPASARCGHAWTVVTPDSQLDAPWAAVAWGWVLAPDDRGGNVDVVMDVDEIVRFALEHRGRHDARCEPGLFVD